MHPLAGMALPFVSVTTNQDRDMSQAEHIQAMCLDPFFYFNLYMT